MARRTRLAMDGTSWAEGQKHVYRRASLSEMEHIHIHGDGAWLSRAVCSEDATKYRHYVSTLQAIRLCMRPLFCSTQYDTRSRDCLTCALSSDGATRNSEARYGGSMQKLVVLQSWVSLRLGLQQQQLVLLFRQILPCACTSRNSYPRPEPRHCLSAPAGISA